MADLKFEAEIDLEIDNQMCSRVVLKWNLDLECRSWGIKSFDVSIPDQNIPYICEIDDLEGNVKEVAGILTISQDTGIEIEYPQEGNSKWIPTICPQKLEVNGNKITLIF